MIIIVETVIYKISNIKNGKFYIGSSSNIKERFNHHKWELNNNRHINKHLQNSWNKHGQDNFEFEVIDSIFGDRDAGYKLEQWYLDSLTQGAFKDCYNFSKYARVPRTTVEKLICVYDYNGAIVEKDFTEVISKKYKINRRRLQDVCRELHKKHKNGFLFRYEGHTPDIEGREDFKDREHIIHLDPLGGFIDEFLSIAEANSKYNYHDGNVRTSLENKTAMQDNTHYVYKFDYQGNYSKTNLSTQELLSKLKKGKIDISGYFFVVQIFDIEGNHVRNFKSLKEVSESMNLEYYGLCTHVHLKKKNKFKKDMIYNDKYIIHISGIYDTLEVYKHNIPYFEIVDENNIRTITSVVGKACTILGINYDVFYRRKRDNVKNINNKTIIYHNSNG